LKILFVEGFHMDIDTSTQQRISSWLAGRFDNETKSEILKLQKSNPKKLRDLFYTDLAFGTGGLRGLMDVGTNRMNIYTVRRASLGLANYIKKDLSTASHKVVVGYDSRHNSRSYAEETAKVLAAKGIHVFLLQDIRPTPFISFACRHLQCIAAVMITASHNPSEYNGYKVYWSDGGQIVPPHDKGIMAEVLAITNYDDIELCHLPSPLIEMVDASLDNEYLKAINGLQQKPQQNQAHGGDLKIVYSSLHGAGITLAPKALNDWGFKNVALVKDQCVTDGNFPTVKSPNPEYPETLTKGIETLQQSHADILFVTDPDADRLGVVVMHKQQPITLSGNEVASLCTAYLATCLQEKKALSKDLAVVTTIVSTDLLPVLCKSFGIECIEVLTGFKYIGEKIHQWETSHSHLKFLFGAEESYGYLVGTHSRDKDAIVSCCLLAEIALDAKKNGKTLSDLLHELYAKLGVFRQMQYSIDFPPGKEGMDTMQAIMKKLRHQPIEKLEDSSVVIREDYLNLTRFDCENQTKQKILLPVSDVLLYRFSDDSKIVIRPSGTEPKLKIYAGVRITDFTNVDEGICLADKKLIKLVEATKAKIVDTHDV